MITVSLVLLIIAAVCFLWGATKQPTTVNMGDLGLLFVTLYLIFGNTGLLK